MSYAIKQKASHFKITDPEGAKNALMSFMLKQHSDMPYMSVYNAMRQNSITEMLRECRWDYAPDMGAITFTGKNIGMDADIMKTIAPYVRAGSYIDLTGEDGSETRWQFNGKTMASIEWDDAVQTYQENCFVLVTYSFDSNVVLIRCASEEEAKKYIKTDTENEIRINRENGLNPDARLYTDDDGSMSLHEPKQGYEDVTTWKIIPFSDIRTAGEIYPAE